MPTIEELLAMPYTDIKASGVMTVEDYRQQYRLHGRPVRWWKAHPIPAGTIGPNGEPRDTNGHYYVEQSQAVGGKPLSEARAIFWSTMTSVPHREFGYVAQAMTEIGVLPDEIYLSKFDRIAPSDIEWLARNLVTRGSHEHDRLPNKPVTNILSVVVNGELMDSDDYRATENGILWENNAPSGNSKYSVKYSYHPLFEFQGSEHGILAKDVKGNYLPQRGALKWLQGGGENE